MTKLGSLLAVLLAAGCVSLPEGQPSDSQVDDASMDARIDSSMDVGTDSIVVDAMIDAANVDAANVDAGSSVLGGPCNGSMPCTAGFDCILDDGNALGVCAPSGELCAPCAQSSECREASSVCSEGQLTDQVDSQSREPLGGERFCAPARNTDIAGYEGRSNEGPRFPQFEKPCEIVRSISRRELVFPCTSVQDCLGAIGTGRNNSVVCLVQTGNSYGPAQDQNQTPGFCSVYCVEQGRGCPRGSECTPLSTSNLACIPNSR